MRRVSDTTPPAGTLRFMRSFGPVLLACAVLTSACVDDAAADTVATNPVSEQVPPSLSTTTKPTTAASTTPRPSTTTTQTTETAAPVWTAARAEGRLPVFATPRSDRPFRTLDRTTILGTPTVVFVLDATEKWLNVMVPGRPNGQTGWVRQADVVMYEVGTRAVIDLSDRTITVFEGETKIFETAVGIGSPASPTPAGLFFITDAVRITNPNGPWGPYAFGLSARSDTVTEFNGGDGIIGIHGTNRPNSIGEAQSLGCVRLPNGVMLELSELLSVGSPVTIEA